MTTTRANPQSIELPIVLQKEINSYLYHAFPLCVILTDDRLFPWFMEHYMEIFCYNYDNASRDFKIDFIEGFLYGRRNSYCDVLDVLSVGALTHNHSNINDFLIENINGGYHAIVFVDEYYLPGKEGYRKNHFLHEYLIYGYNHHEKTFSTVAFDNRNNFSKLAFSYEDFSQAYLEGKLLYGEPWSLPFSVTLLKPKGYKNYYPFSVNRFLQKLTNYLYQKEPGSDLIYFTHPNQLGKGRTNGIGVYDKFIEQLQILESVPQSLDYSHIHLLYEHKKSIHKRLGYIIDTYELTGETKDMCHEFEIIVQQLNLIRSAFIKLTFTKSKSDLEEIIDLMNTSKTMEISILSKIHQNLCKQLSVNPSESNTPITQ